MIAGKTGLALLMLFLAPFVELRAQETPVLVAGTKVRVSAPSVASGRILATVEALQPDALVLRVPGSGAAMTVPLASVARIDVNRGQKSRTLLGAGVGLLVGGAATALFMGVLLCPDSDTSCSADDWAGAFLIFGLPPIALGTLIGSLIKVDRWEEVPLDQLRIHPAANVADGFTISASVRL